MITRRPSAERGRVRLDGLDTRHTFSFGDYYDPAHIGFRSLRVLNEDLLEPASGFPMHSHRDMEILTVVLEGALEHRDSLGSGSVLRPENVQRMTAGRGVRHSEFNASKTERLHLLQIWILPETTGLTPEYEEREFPTSGSANRLQLLASRDGREASLTLHQDVSVHRARLDPGQRLNHDIEKDRHVWIQIMRGTLSVQGLRLQEGDGAALSGEERLLLEASTASDLLLFDLA